MLGLHPDPFTLRQLDHMADGRADLEWTLNSWIRAALINVNRGKGRPIEPSKVNPYELSKRKRRGPTNRDTEMGFAMMRAMFCANGGKS